MGQTDQLGIADWIASITEERTLHTGGALYVSVDHERVVDIGFGVDYLDQPLASDALIPLYCTGKPLVALGILRLCQAGELSLDDQLGNIVKGLPEWLTATTIEMLLTHSAGLHEVDLVTARLLTAQSRQALIRMLPLPNAWNSGADHAYATYGAWHLLGEVIEALTLEPFQVFLQDQVLELYGIGAAEYITRFGPDTHAAHGHRITVTIDFVDNNHVPLLAESGPETSSEWNPAYGSYASMNALAALWEGVLSDCNGAGRVLDQDLALRAVTTQTPEWYDDNLQRKTQFGYGIMTQLETVLSPQLGPDSFGHTGLQGSALGVVDRSRNVVIAAAFNGLADLESVQVMRRGPLLKRVIEAVDAAS